MKKFILRTFFVLCIFNVSTLAQSSVSFELEKTVISGGGERSSSKNFVLEGTVGEPAAGNMSFSSSYILRDGFWVFDPLTPTSANIHIAGSVVRANGRGIPSALIKITDPITGLQRHVYTGSFGMFLISELPSNRAYIISVEHRSFMFEMPSQTITPIENVNGLKIVSFQ